MVSMNDKLKPRVARAVERFAETLRAALGDDLVEIRVFGSQVTGRATDESDVDLFVLVRKRTWAVESTVSDAAFEAGLESDLFLAPTIYGQDELARPALRNSPFVRNVYREGVAA